MVNVINGKPKDEIHRIVRLVYSKKLSQIGVRVPF